MGVFGDYETVQEAYRHGNSIVYRARKQGQTAEDYAIKVHEPVAEAFVSPEQAKRRIDRFVESAKAQEAVSEGKHWAPIHALGNDDRRAYYVTDHYETDLASCVGMLPPTSGRLFHIVSSVLRGLLELGEASHRRSHGNLKLSNILLSRIDRVSRADIVLTDPVPASLHDRDKHELADLRAVGEVIYGLVMGRPYSGSRPTSPSPEWARLGRHADGWRELCCTLVNREHTFSGHLTLANIDDRVQHFRPRPTKLLVAAACVLLCVAVPFGYHFCRDFFSPPPFKTEIPDSQWQQEYGPRWLALCSAYEDWLAAITHKLDPEVRGGTERRARWEKDPALKRWLAEAGEVKLDPRQIIDQPEASFKDLKDLKEIEGDDNAPVRKARTPAAVAKTQEAYKVVQEIADLLGFSSGVAGSTDEQTPPRWQTLAHTREAATKTYPGRGWNRPAAYLKAAAERIKPEGRTLAEAVDDLLQAADKVKAIDKLWAGIETDRKTIEGTGSQILGRFGDFVKAQTSSEVGASGPAQPHDLDDLIENLKRIRPLELEERKGTITQRLVTFVENTWSSGSVNAKETLTGELTGVPLADDEAPTEDKFSLWLSKVVYVYTEPAEDWWKRIKEDDGIVSSEAVNESWQTQRDALLGETSLETLKSDRSAYVKVRDRMKAVTDFLVGLDNETWLPKGVPRLRSGIVSRSWHGDLPDLLLAEREKALRKAVASLRWDEGGPSVESGAFRATEGWKTLCADYSRSRTGLAKARDTLTVLGNRLDGFYLPEEQAEDGHGTVQELSAGLEEPAILAVVQAVEAARAIRERAQRLVALHAETERPALREGLAADEGDDATLLYAAWRRLGELESPRWPDTEQEWEDERTAGDRLGKAFAEIDDAVRKLGGLLERETTRREAVFQAAQLRDTGDPVLKLFGDWVERVLPDLTAAKEPGQVEPSTVLGLASELLTYVQDPEDDWKTERLDRKLFEKECTVYKDAQDPGKRNADLFRAWLVEAPNYRRLTPDPRGEPAAWLAAIEPLEKRLNNVEELDRSMKKLADGTVSALQRDLVTLQSKVAQPEGAEPAYVLPAVAKNGDAIGEDAALLATVKSGIDEALNQLEPPRDWLARVKKPLKDADPPLNSDVLDREWAPRRDSLLEGVTAAKLEADLELYSKKRDEVGRLESFLRALDDEHDLPLGVPTPEDGIAAREWHDELTKELRETREKTLTDALGLVQWANNVPAEDAARFKAKESWRSLCATYAGTRSKLARLRDDFTRIQDLVAAGYRFDEAPDGTGVPIEKLYGSWRSEERLGGTELQAIFGSVRLLQGVAGANDREALEGFWPKQAQGSLAVAHAVWWRFGQLQAPAPPWPADLKELRREQELLTALRAMIPGALGDTATARRKQLDLSFEEQARSRWRTCLGRLTKPDDLLAVLKRAPGFGVGSEELQQWVQEQGDQDLLALCAGNLAVEQTEVAHAAWLRLGDLKWPENTKQLEEEVKLSGRLSGLLPEAAAAILEESETRWQERFNQLSAADDITAAVEQLPDLRVDLEQVDPTGEKLGQSSNLLEPEARFNLVLCLLRRDTERPDWRKAKTDTLSRRDRFVERVGTLGSRVLEQKPVETLLQELGKVKKKREGGAEELRKSGPGAAGWTLANPTENPRAVTFEKEVAGETHSLEFVLVRPGGTSSPGDAVRKSAYLGTSEVPMGLFVGVANTEEAKERLRALNSDLEKEIAASGGFDPREGPRSWSLKGRRFSATNTWLVPPTGAQKDADRYAPEILAEGPPTGMSTEPSGQETRKPILGGFPVQYVPPGAAIQFARSLGCRLPASWEWQAALRAEGDRSGRRNVRDAQTWKAQHDFVKADDGKHGLAWPDAGIFWPEHEDVANAGREVDAVPRPVRDEVLWFDTVTDQQEGAPRFHHLVGNVAEYVFDDPDHLDKLPPLSPADFEALLTAEPLRMFVIGASSLSPPELREDTPYPVKSGDADSDFGFSDVGFRLAFTAPDESPGDQISRALKQSVYLARKQHERRE